MSTTVGRTSLEIVSGDITGLAVDAVANAATTDLWMDAGVAGALKRAGGEAVERDAVAQGPIALGEAIATAGHDLDAHWVIHAAVMGPDLQTDAHAIARATYSTLAMAERVRARSLAVPAFGTGAGGFPLYQCASIMVAESLRFLKATPRTCLRHVLFAVYSEAAQAAFTHALAGSGRFNRRRRAEIDT
jgi:O-acetyl-ADP-ribose deacetylase (regulator of RNase III)